MHRTHMRFEDLDVWQRARQLSADVYKKLDRLHNFGFRDQMTRSYFVHPEQYCRRLRAGIRLRNVLQFLSLRKRLLRRMRTQIYIGMDVGYVDESHGQLWLREAKEISSMLSGPPGLKLAAVS